LQTPESNEDLDESVEPAMLSETEPEEIPESSQERKERGWRKIEPKSSKSGQ
jgi:hypothetical protein